MGTFMLRTAFCAAALCWAFGANAQDRQSTDTDPVRSAVVHIASQLSYVELAPDGRRLPRNQNRIGTGVVVAKDFILTVAHIIPDLLELPRHTRSSPDTRLTIKITRDKAASVYVLGHVVSRDDTLDLALLKLARDHDWKPLCFGNSDHVQIKDSVEAYSATASSENDAKLLPTSGTLNSKHGEFGRWEFIGMNAGPGFSGSPVAGANGKVIGLISGGLTGRKSILVIPEAYTRGIRALAGPVPDHACSTARISAAPTPTSPPQPVVPTQINVERSMPAANGATKVCTVDCRDCEHGAPLRSNPTLDESARFAAVKNGTSMTYLEKKDTPNGAWYKVQGIATRRAGGETGSTEGWIHSRNLQLPCG